MSKEDAQNAYDAAQERYDAAFEDLKAARADLDEYLREEEARNHAVFLGFEEGDEKGVEMARDLAIRRREQKEAIKATQVDGPIGGVV